MHLDLIHAALQRFLSNQMVSEMSSLRLNRKQKIKENRCLSITSWGISSIQSAHGLCNLQTSQLFKFFKLPGKTLSANIKVCLVELLVKTINVYASKRLCIIEGKLYFI